MQHGLWCHSNWLAASSGLIESERPWNALLVVSRQEGGWQDIRCSHSWRASHKEDGLDVSM